MLCPTITLSLATPLDLDTIGIQYFKEDLEFLNYKVCFDQDVGKMRRKKDGEMDTFTNT